MVAYNYKIFVFNDTATAEIYTLSLRNALPICPRAARPRPDRLRPARHRALGPPSLPHARPAGVDGRRRRGLRERARSEEHTSELQSRQYLVCRLLLEKK